MRQPASSELSVVKRAEKQEKLKNYILQTIAAAHRAGDASKTETLLLVARSAESPVALALVSLASELAESGLAIRAIFTDIESETTTAGWTVNGPAIAFARDVRWARNARLTDAHEQLVLTHDACWIGDCMRRDPAKTDAFEHFVGDNAETTRLASVSFERLWRHAEPLAIQTSKRGIDTLSSSIPEAAQVAGLTPNADGTAPIVSTRH
jgi:hypothetical protein